MRRNARLGERAVIRRDLFWPFDPSLLAVSGQNVVLVAGASKETLMVKLGHADFRTTQRYVNLAGVVFADEAAALEARMNGSAVESSTDLASPEGTWADLTPLGDTEEQPSY
jgi:hypothetical protein